MLVPRKPEEPDVEAVAHLAYLVPRERVERALGPGTGGRGQFDLPAADPVRAVAPNALLPALGATMS